MDKYIFSKFNYYQQSSFTNSFLIYNSLHRKIVRLPIKYAEKIGISNGFNCKYTFLDDDLESKLKKMGIIVSDSYDEESEAHLKYLKEISEPTLSLIIIPTYRCNFRCPYCYQDHEKGSVMGEDIQDAIIKYVRKHIADYTSVEISWFGGEPLLCAHIIVKINNAIKQICKARYKSFKSSITTNGYLLTKELFETLLDCGVRRYFITVDGLEAEHDKQRYLANKGGTFKVIIDNLLSIKELPNSRHFSVNLRSNISKSNIDNLERYLEYMNKRFSNDSRFAFFFRKVYDWGGDTIDGFRTQLLQEEADKIIFDKLLQSDYKMNYLEFYLDIAGSVVCYASKINSYIINPDGTLNKCTCTEMGGNNLVGQLLPSGDMQLNQSLLGKWSSQYLFSEKCENCFMKGLCLKSYCVSASVMNNQLGENCFIAKDVCDKLLLLLDKCDKDYKYIIDLKKG